MAKTTKSEFNRFKKVFLYWQQKLGLTQYRACFTHTHLKDSYAEIIVNESGHITTVYFTKETKSPEGYDCPETHSKHEALHLLLSKLQWLAEQRYVAHDEIEHEVEAVIRRLEKVLK